MRTDLVSFAERSWGVAGDEICSLSIDLLGQFASCAARRRWGFLSVMLPCAVHLTLLQYMLRTARAVYALMYMCSCGSCYQHVIKSFAMQH